MSPEEVTELSEEEQIYFYLLELHLRGIPTDPDEVHVLIEPPGPVVNFLVWCVVVGICAVPWVAIGVILYVVLT
jgi:hypothetical protein